MAVGDLQQTQEGPDVRVGPVDDGIDSLEARPAGVCRAAEAKLGCRDVNYFVGTRSRRGHTSVRICPPSTNDNRLNVGELFLVDSQRCFHTFSALCSCQVDSGEHFPFVLGESGEGGFGCAWLGDALDLLRALRRRLAAEEVEFVGLCGFKDEYFEFGERRRNGYIECGYRLARLSLGEAAAECRGNEMQKNSAYMRERKLARRLKLAGRCAL